MDNTVIGQYQAANQKVQTTEELPDAPAPAKGKTRWSVAELYDDEFPEPRWVIPGLIPVGLTILGGRPKAGKSLFMNNVACAVGSGGNFFKEKIEQGEVLYFFLEDPPRVLKDRQTKMQIPRDAKITWERETQPLQQGGLDDLLIELTGHDYRLVVIDTLATAMPGVDHTKDAVILDRVLNDLHRMAVDRNMGIVSNDHTRKAGDKYPDPIDDISGSTAKSRNADHIMAIYTQQGKKGATLRGKGREIREFEYTMHFDPDIYCWILDGDKNTLEITDQRQAIIEALQTLGRVQEPAIRKATEIDHSQLYKQLQALVKAGQVKRDGTKQIFYWVE